MGRPSDIIVVGAGIVGCSVAYELARRGASVDIVDDRPVGMGATQASAGVLAPYIEAREEGPLLALTVRRLALFDDFVAALARGARGGLMIEAHGFVAAGELTRALVAAARRHGAQLIEQSRVRRITGRDDDI